jgi:ssDNA-binding Zn-finger/Zn-ribbon topoisomerase 1
MTNKNKMKLKNIHISLKSNPNISFDIRPKLCACGMPMFLRKSQNGDIFWSCKNFHKDENLRKCDHTKDVSCFKCNSGEIIKKINQKTGEVFYGCTDFSKISDTSCNIIIPDSDIDPLIKQVNDAIKFQLNLKVTHYNASDEKRIKKLIEENKTNQKTEVKKEINKEVKTNTSEKSGLFTIFTKHIKSVAVVGILFLTFLGITQGANVEFSLFGDLFHFKINPASSSDIHARIDESNKTVEVTNTANETVDVSNVAMNMNGMELNFNNLEDTTLKPGETLVLNENELEDILEKELSGDDTEESQENDSFIDSIFSLFGGVENSTEPIDYATEPEEEPIYQQEAVKEIVNDIWNNEENISFTATIKEKGEEVVEEIKTATKSKINYLQERIGDYKSIEESLDELKHEELQQREIEEYERTREAILLEEIEREEAEKSLLREYNEANLYSAEQRLLR